MAIATRTVRLEGVPIRLMRDSEAQVQSMLAAAERAIAADRSGVTTSLAMVVRTLLEEYRDLSTVMWAELDAAEAAGHGAADVSLEVPVTVASATETWLRLLEHLDELATNGELEHEPTPPRIQSLRRWIVAEITAQLREDAAPRRYTVG